LSRALLYSSVKIEEAAITACAQSSAFLGIFEDTKTLIEVLNHGCPADSHMILCASVSAWLKIL